MVQSYTSNIPGMFAAEVRKRGGSYTITIPRVVVNKLALRPGIECRVEVEKDNRRGSFQTVLKANQHIVYFTVPALTRKQIDIELKNVVNIKIERPRSVEPEC